nr:hypothetical protein CFP56_04054 [Quercus suber]
MLENVKQSKLDDELPNDRQSWPKRIRRFVKVDISKLSYDNGRLANLYLSPPRRTNEKSGWFIPNSGVSSGGRSKSRGRECTGCRGSSDEHGASNCIVNWQMGN